MGFDLPAPLVLPGLLGVRVGASDLNPLALPIAKEGESKGLTVSDAKVGIRSVLAEISVALSFRHVPFNQIELGLYEDLLRYCIDRGLVVGLGLKWQMIAGDGNNSETLHVVRVLGVEGDNIVLFDDSMECDPPSLTRPWVDVERAVLAAQDGFWIMGEKGNLVLPYGPDSGEAE
jgi:hypothetical protein